MSRLLAAWSASVFVAMAFAGVPALPQPAAVNPARAATVTLQKEYRLNDALAGVARQTGMSVPNLQPTNNPTLKLQLSNSPFWEAVDSIARQANASLSLYSPAGVALSGSPFRPAPVHYGGVFRFAAKRVGAERDLESGLHLCNLALEVAWEPRFRPFYLEVTDVLVEFAPDAKGNRLRVQQPGKGYESVVGRPAHEVELRVRAPERSSPAVALFQGKAKVVGPNKMLTFRFPRLKPVRQPGEAINETQEGVRVSLRKVIADEERWTFEVGLDYPPGGPAFESHQSWLGNNLIALERGKQRLTPRANDQRTLLLTDQPPHRAVIQYYFTPPEKTRLADWALVYQTPGRIVEASVPFEFRDLPLH
jgi:hypothetical protein